METRLVILTQLVDSKDFVETFPISKWACFGIGIPVAYLSRANR
ncbi:hypothetical protein FRUB_01496 [Fimbriiglobus ruber]|uniref:Uncharacterized protein n=1 Tax=Fimbriiglobus ruber TaxID=1908690 RepID=A0A225E997_9BACT|nr:hypothetical protein FRUB_01496 [Fimbriiglobus ruber]